MNLEKLLAGTVFRHWHVRRTIVLDWREGPRAGVCAFDSPPCECFFQLAARPLEADQIAAPLFTVSELPVGSTACLEEMYAAAGKPSAPLWVPTLDCSASERQEKDSRLNALLVAARPTSLLIATSDWLKFDGCWDSDPDGQP